MKEGSISNYQPLLITPLVQRIGERNINTCAHNAHQDHMNHIRVTQSYDASSFRRPNLHEFRLCIAHNFTDRRISSIISSSPFSTFALADLSELLPFANFSTIFMRVLCNVFSHRIQLPLHFSWWDRLDEWFVELFMPLWIAVSLMMHRNLLSCRRFNWSHCAVSLMSSVCSYFFLRATILLANFMSLSWIFSVFTQDLTVIGHIKKSCKVLVSALVVGIIWPASYLS